MRLLHVMASGAPGGGAEHLLGLLPALVARGHSVEAWVGEDGCLGEELRQRGVASEAVHLMRSRCDLVEVFRLAWRLRGRVFDAVHWHGTRAGFYGALLGKRQSVYSAHGLAFRKEHGVLQRLVFSGAEVIACRARHTVSVSRTDLDELISRGYVEASRADYVPNAPRTERLNQRPSRRVARRELGIDQERFVVGTASRLVPQKALDVMIRAMSSLPDALLVVAGDGPLRETLAALAYRLGVDVQWLGHVVDVGRLLSALDTFVLSSAWEGEPIALLEAMACEVPCVATATAGARELLDGGAGVLVPIGDAQALGLALQEARRGIETGDIHGFVALATAKVRERDYAKMAEHLESIYHAIRIEA